MEAEEYVPEDQGWKVLDFDGSEEEPDGDGSDPEPTVSGPEGARGLIGKSALFDRVGALVEPFLLLSVAATVIGGTSIYGGRGGYAGTILGALIITVLNTSIL